MSYVGKWKFHSIGTISDDVLLIQTRLNRIGRNFPVIPIIGDSTIIIIPRGSDFKNSSLKLPW